MTPKPVELGSTILQRMRDEEELVLDTDSIGAGYLAIWVEYGPDKPPFMQFPCNRGSYFPLGVCTFLDIHKRGPIWAVSIEKVDYAGPPLEAVVRDAVALVVMETKSSTELVDHVHFAIQEVPEYGKESVEEGVTYHTAELVCGPPLHSPGIDAIWNTKMVVRDKYDYEGCCEHDVCGWQPR